MNELANEIAVGFETIRNSLPKIEVQIEQLLQQISRNDLTQFSRDIIKGLSKLDFECEVRSICRGFSFHTSNIVTKYAKSTSPRK